MQTSILPTGSRGSPLPCSLVQVSPPSRETWMPLPGPPLSRPHVLYDDLPHAGEQDARVVGIHHEARGADVFVHEQHLLPGLAAVLRAVDAALLLRPVGVA